MGAHVRESFEVDSFFHRKRRSLYVADEDGRLEELYLAAGCDISLDFSAGDQCAGGDRASNDGIFADHDRAFCMNFTFKAAIKLDGAFEVDDALEPDVFSENRECFTVGMVLGSLFIVPHGGSLPFVKGFVGTFKNKQQPCLLLIWEIRSSFSHL